MKKNILLLFTPVIMAIGVTAVSCWATEPALGWLYYDDGTAGNPSSTSKFQGVRFSLPDGVVKTQLFTILFYYSCSDSCPLTIHITGYDHKTKLIAPISVFAYDSWNEIDVSRYNIVVPHNFYIILERVGEGVPYVDDNEDDEGRSFTGRHLASMNTLLSRNLLIEAELGSPVSIPILKEWNVSVTKKLKISIKGNASEIGTSDYSEEWTLYADGSFATDSYLYGIWKQKDNKCIVSLDPEDMIDSIENMVDDHISRVKVTKINFTWKERKDGTIKGSYKIYAAAFFEDYNNLGMIKLQGIFTGAPVK
jgi:hypothetical protein